MSQYFISGLTDLFYPAILHCIFMKESKGIIFKLNLYIFLFFSFH